MIKIALEFGVDIQIQVIFNKLVKLEYLIVVAFIFLVYKIVLLMNYIFYLINKEIFLNFNSRLKQFKQEIFINDAFYESTWYFQGILKIPEENIIYMALYKQWIQIFVKQIQFEFLSEENNYKLIIGGDLKVSQNSPLFTFENRLLSYFPGDIEYISEGQLQEYDYFYLVEIHNNNECVCQSNQRTRIEDVLIEKKGLYEFISQESNCQEFLLSGWIKIQDIIQIEEELNYQLIRLSGNFQNLRLIDAYLCAFQLFYKLSSLRNQIIITTYSYTFPSVNMNFSNNPYLKTQTYRGLGYQIMAQYQYKTLFLFQQNYTKAFSKKNSISIQMQCNQV
ncbi:unnamed protein product [Paramecium sonneborni]|uniref:Transmembrane protein n=1 Tax=Paramecium sonneborni TaxID=65129 RepID=A0A8S1Q1H5_9CILI|nr:unnamed protein product [Paramecium sonneborni]